MTSSIQSTEKISQTDQDLEIPQFVAVTPQPVIKSRQPNPQPVVNPSHNVVKHQVADGDRLFPVTTVTAVAVNGNPSEYSMFVVPKTKSGKFYYNIHGH